jgi:hypothetical protein
VGQHHEEDGDPAETVEDLDAVSYDGVRTV